MILVPRRFALLFFNLYFIDTPKYSRIMIEILRYFALDDGHWLADIEDPYLYHVYYHIRQ